MTTALRGKCSGEAVADLSIVSGACRFVLQHKAFSGPEMDGEHRTAIIQQLSVRMRSAVLLLAQKMNVAKRQQQAAVLRDLRRFAASHYVMSNQVAVLLERLHADKFSQVRSVLGRSAVSTDEGELGRCFGSLQVLMIRQDRAQKEVLEH